MTPREPLLRILIKDMGKNLYGAFCGIGRHCPNDLLFYLALHPATPSHVVCADATAYADFKATIYQYLEQYSKPEFLKRVVTTPNSNNPFEFNELSNREYTARYIAVFRRVRVSTQSSSSIPKTQR